ncbi:MAG: hypothetical protein H7Z14_15690 [Anaerolineae bacterium]|nr:hypothetical protein [Phycisphaerae bacterium]
MHPLTRDQEADRILTVYGNDLPGIMTMLERQFVVLHNRAQVLLTLCGIVISTTGFSGRIIAGTNPLAQFLIIGGVGLVLLSAVIVAWGVLHLYWLTMQTGQDTRSWLLNSLRYRDKKTQSYRVGLVVMLIGLALYVGAIAVMLLYPHEGGLPAR